MVEMNGHFYFKVIGRFLFKFLRFLKISDSYLIKIRSQKVLHMHVRKDQMIKNCKKKKLTSIK